MSKTLAELRAQAGPAPLPRATRTVTLVEGQHLLDRSDQLIAELESISIAVSRETADGEQVGRPRKAAEGSEHAARAEEIKAEQQRLWNELADVQGEIVLQGIPGGDWQRFKDANPPREDNAADRTLALNQCNASALFGELGRFVHKWNDEAVTRDDWDSWLAERITYADRRDLVTAVVDMYEKAAPRAPFSPSSSSTTEPAETD